MLRVVEHFSGLGAEPPGNSPAAFAKYIGEEIAKWGKVVKAAGIRPD